ncbi:replication protein RepA [Microvirgula aerodenitrificans]|uniref:replication protein RepA n=1 Tax=Microvirgula aerodenitrificans TaxID=57480 RepID=UPI00248E2214|nr:replication protein RepA [Microvirgula aerodenitrificans]
MTVAKPTTFNEAEYRDDLVRAGVDPDEAAEIAAKTARVRAEAIKKAALKNKQQQDVPPVKAAATAQDDIFAVPAETMELADTIPAAAVPPPAKTRKTTRRISSKEPAPLSASAVFDYRNGEIPERVRELIDAHLAIEAQDAKSAGTLGFMTRSLAIATLPHRKTPDFRFVRRNGDFTLTMMTAHPQGLPYGTLPRLLLTWVCTEVAQKRERVLSLGDNLAAYLAELGLHSTGGKRGDITRLKHAMTTLFSSVISCHYEGKDAFVLQNVLLADKVDWWTPQNPEEAGQWQSTLMLSEPFYKECIEHVLPFDMRAVRGLRQSPLALDIYIWLTYRMSYLARRTTIPWVALAGQFGSGYAMNEQGLRDFKRAFLRELKHVLVIYPQAKLSDSANGLVMYPSPPHVAFKTTPIQKRLGF